MSNSARLTLDCRHTISSMRMQGATQAEIGLAVGCDQSTVSRELTRLGSTTGYDPQAAQKDADAKTKTHARQSVLDKCSALVRHLINYMRNDYSIWQALELIRKKYPDLPTISAQGVYDWLYTGSGKTKKLMRKLMQRPRSRRKPRAKTPTGQGKIPNMTPIAERLFEPADRSVFGHWEGDLVLGRNSRSAVITLVERKTRYTLVIKVSSRKTKDVIEALVNRIKRSGVVVRSITWDQGKEMSEHGRLSKLLGVPIYFADAHSPWQRGTNENTNGVVRRKLPKGTNLNLSVAKIRNIQKWLNSRPMRVLSKMSPEEAYATEREIYALAT